MSPRPRELPPARAFAEGSASPRPPPASPRYSFACVTRQIRSPVEPFRALSDYALQSKDGNPRLEQTTRVMFPTASTTSLPCPPLNLLVLDGKLGEVLVVKLTEHLCQTINRKELTRLASI